MRQQILFNPEEISHNRLKKYKIVFNLLDFSCLEVFPDVGRKPVSRASILLEHLFLRTYAAYLQEKLSFSGFLPISVLMRGNNLKTNIKERFLKENRQRENLFPASLCLYAPILYSSLCTSFSSL